MDSQLEADIIYLLNINLPDALKRSFSILDPLIQAKIETEKNTCILHQMFPTSDAVGNLIKCPERLEAHLKLHEQEKIRFRWIIGTLLTTSLIIISLLSLITVNLNKRILNEELKSKFSSSRTSD